MSYKLYHQQVWGTLHSSGSPLHHWLYDVYGLPNAPSREVTDALGLPSFCKKLLCKVIGMSPTVYLIVMIVGIGPTAKYKELQGMSRYLKLFKLNSFVNTPDNEFHKMATN